MNFRAPFMNAGFNSAPVVLAVPLPVDWTTEVIYLVDFQSHLCTNLHIAWEAPVGMYSSSFKAAVATGLFLN